MTLDQAKNFGTKQDERNKREKSILISAISMAGFGVGGYFLGRKTGNQTKYMYIGFGVGLLMGGLYTNFIKK